MPLHVPAVLQSQGTKVVFAQFSVPSALELVAKLGAAAHEGLIELGVLVHVGPPAAGIAEDIGDVLMREAADAVDFNAADGRCAVIDANCCFRCIAPCFNISM